MSRALGDLQYKNPINTFEDDVQLPKRRKASASGSIPNERGNFLSNEPHLVRVKLQADRRYVLLLVSDGITDQTDDTSLMQLVMKLTIRGSRAGHAAQEIATTAAEHPASDNATCIIALLDGNRA